MVQGFAHLSSTFAVMNTRSINTSNSRSTCNVQYSNTKIKNALFHRTTAGPLSASQDDVSNQGEGEETINTADDELSDDYDFEAGFQARLKQEGGRKGVQAKAAKRSVDSATKVVTSSLKQSRQSCWLLGLTLLHQRLLRHQRMENSWGSEFARQEDVNKHICDASKEEEYEEASQGTVLSRATNEDLANGKNLP
eukprot:scaffold18085_cov45-Attheya_sp.AAC.2